MIALCVWRLSRGSKAVGRGRPDSNGLARVSERAPWGCDPRANSVGSMTAVVASATLRFVAGEPFRDTAKECRA